MDVSFLPAVNACLNGTSAVLLTAGYIQIRKGHRDTHRKLMIAALIVSGLFLISYLTYHYIHGSTKFTGQGIVRTVYFTILLTHTILAAAIVPLVIITVLRAFRERFDKHRKIARWTLPLWFYVSVTGVIIYLMLYQLYPPA